MRISYSKVDLYSSCPQRYKFKYIDKLEPDKTYTPLLFGGACDRAFNYLLLRAKRNKPIYIETAKQILLKYMSKWDGKNELVFYKSDLPDDVTEEMDLITKQWKAWNNLIDVGEKMLETYRDEILPMFDEILAVQTRKEVKNEDGDSLILIVDFTAKLKDGRIVTFDNKTAGDAKKSYPKTAVKKSKQLAIYSEYANTPLAGYIVLQKKLKDDKIVWTHIIDEVSEEQKEEVFENIDNALCGIKAEEFPKNEKACFSYGQKCPYFGACKYSNYEGLIKKDRK